MTINVTKKQFVEMHNQLAKKFNFTIIDKKDIPSSILYGLLNASINFSKIKAITIPIGNSKPNLAHLGYDFQINIPIGNSKTTLVHLGYDFKKTNKIELSTLIHESRHADQFRGKGTEIWVRYLTDATYRGKVETEAYTESIQFAWLQFGQIHAERHYSSVRKALSSFYHLPDSQLKTAFSRLESVMQILRRGGEIPGLKVVPIVVNLLGEIT